MFQKAIKQIGSVGNNISIIVKVNLDITQIVNQFENKSSKYNFK